jgi:NAD(P)H-dependent FMN reductase
VARPVRVVGLGGSLRAASTSFTALKAALEGATASGAEVQLISVRIWVCRCTPPNTRPRQARTNSPTPYTGVMR